VTLAQLQAVPFDAAGLESDVKMLYKADDTKAGLTTRTKHRLRARFHDPHGTAERRCARPCLIERALRVGRNRGHENDGPVGVVAPR